MNEKFRREETARINSEVRSEDIEKERIRLTLLHGKVWDTNQLHEDFEAIGFAAPFLVVRRKSDGEKGSLEFQHSPRLYFNFVKNNE